MKLLDYMVSLFFCETINTEKNKIFKVYSSNAYKSKMFD